jgi:ATP-dependent RNA helicase DOB1
MGALGGDSKGEDPASATSGQGRKGKSKKGATKGELWRAGASLEGN